jgi:hypothetical protein
MGPQKIARLDFSIIKIQDYWNFSAFICIDIPYMLCGSSEISILCLSWKNQHPGILFVYAQVGTSISADCDLLCFTMVFFISK